ncbi:MAG TPA: hypothetical protein VHL58_15105 [Thermoanaerobaculia bacterium]|nr:hypothetical protein [Thermoanaerobaculia bacterium]
MQDKEDVEVDDYEDQIEQMIVENGMLIHSVVNLLVQKGILKQDEVDAEMDKLYEQMEQFEDDDEEEEEEEEEEV